MLNDSSMGRCLQELADHMRELGLPSESAAELPQGGAARDGALVLQAKRLYAERRARERFFSNGLFGEPAWDLLLDVYVQTAGGRQVDITSASIGCCCPPTTALRWITLLEDKGFLQRAASGTDRRRTYLSLTPTALVAIENYLMMTMIG